MSNPSAPVNKLRVVVIREQDGTPATMQVTGADAQRIVAADGAVWLRLAKRGDAYKAYYSSNGSVYR
jgi:alpha-glucuronidase